jgi:hypothetical protein
VNVNEATTAPEALPESKSARIGMSSDTGELQNVRPLGDELGEGEVAKVVEAEARHPRPLQSRAELVLAAAAGQSCAGDAVESLLSPPFRRPSRQCDRRVLLHVRLMPGRVRLTARRRNEDSPQR